MTIYEALGLRTPEREPEEPGIAERLRAVRAELAAVTRAFQETADEAEIESRIYEMKALECQARALYEEAKAQGVTATAGSAAAQRQTVGPRSLWPRFAEHSRKAQLAAAGSQKEES